VGLEPLLRQVLEKYTNDVKVVMKHFPIQSHAFAKKASLAALAAARQGKFWEMHERLYTAQKELNDARIDAIAQEVGLDLERYNADLKDPAISSLIVRDMNDARKAEVRGTPTVFVNGKPLPQRNLQGFTEAIEAELKKKR
jgi:protein-disulfide isomerase